MSIDLSKLRAYLTASNIGKLIAVLMALYGLPSLADTAPMAVSSSGIPVDDLLSTLAPFIGAIATWLGANWLKATPELVAAAIAMVRSPKDPDVAARFEVACLRMLGTRHEGNAEVQAAVAKLAQVLAEARFPKPRESVMVANVTPEQRDEFRAMAERVIPRPTVPTVLS